MLFNRNWLFSNILISEGSWLSGLPAKMAATLEAYRIVLNPRMQIMPLSAIQLNPL